MKKNINKHIKNKIIQRLNKTSKPVTKTIKADYEDDLDDLSEEEIYDNRVEEEFDDTQIDLYYYLVNDMGYEYEKAFNIVNENEFSYYGDDRGEAAHNIADNEPDYWYSKIVEDDVGIDWEVVFNYYFRYDDYIIETNSGAIYELYKL